MDEVSIMRVKKRTSCMLWQGTVRNKTFFMVWQGTGHHVLEGTLGHYVWYVGRHDGAGLVSVMGTM